MTNEEDENKKVDFVEKLLGTASVRSRLMSSDNMLRELTRGIVNEKWINLCCTVMQKATLREIFDVYLNKIQQRIWIERCNETIELKNKWEYLEI